MCIGHRKEIWKPIRWPSHIINAVDKTKLSFNAPHVETKGF